MGKERPALELEYLAPGRIVGEHIRAGDVGRHEIGRELNARKAQAQRFAQAPHHQSFAQARHAFEQAVAAANERNKHLLDQFFMADDHPSHLGAQPVEGPPRVDDTLFDFIYGLHDATPPVEDWMTGVME